MGLFNTIRMGSSAAGDYEVEQSLRFDDDQSAPHRFHRTIQSGGNRKTFTLAVWVKRSELGASSYSNSIGGNDGQTILHTAGNSNRGWIKFNSDDTLAFDQGDDSQGRGLIDTVAKYRDTSAWYHLCFVADYANSTAADRAKIFVNGVRQDVTTTRSFDDADGKLNDAQLHDLGFTEYGQGYTGSANWSNFFCGYMAEFHFIDGLALDPTSFTKTNPVTGQLIPKEYSGSFGTTGWYLEFKDNSGTTATTLGKDTSGNSNNWTPNGFVTGDVVKDTPTNNFATLQMMGTPFSSGASFSEGNLKFTTGSTSSARNLNRQAFAPMLVNSGKWYAEFVGTASDNANMIGVGPYQVELSPTVNNTRYAYVYSDGDSYLRTAGSESIGTYGGGIPVNNVVGVYLDMDATTPVVYFSSNGQWADGSGNFDESSPTAGLTLGDSFFTTDTGSNDGFGTFILSSGGGSYNMTFHANFGQDSTFAGLKTAGGNTDTNGIGDFKYAVPTGAKALCSANLPDPSITFPNKHFGTLTYSGNDSTQTISDTDEVDFTPDFTWVKRRDGTNSHILTNSVTGVTNYQISSRDNAEGTNAAFLTAFVNGGFTSGNNGDMNGSGRNYVAWNWKGADSTATNTDGTNDSYVRANTTAGFSIVKYVGHSSASVVGHGLGVAPEIIFVKQRNGTNDWRVWADGFTDTNGKYFSLNNNIPLTSGSDKWNGSPTSTVFGVANDDSTGGSSKEFIAYCFNSVAGYSKIGSYRGNGNADGTFVYTGFRPAFILFKNATVSSNWELYDTRRPYGVDNPALRPLYANLNNSEETHATLPALDIFSNGFKPRSTWDEFNTNGSSYLYLAFAEAPFKYSRAR